jgi:hypothetical protein
VTLSAGVNSRYTQSSTGLPLAAKQASAASARSTTPLSRSRCRLLEQAELRRVSQLPGSTLQQGAKAWQEVVACRMQYAISSALVGPWLTLPTGTVFTVAVGAALELAWGEPVPDAVAALVAVLFEDIAGPVLPASVELLVSSEASGRALDVPVAVVEWPESPPPPQAITIPSAQEAAM